MVNGKYVLNEPEAEAVRKIFEEYINGKSLKTIAAEMCIPYNSAAIVLATPARRGGIKIWSAE